MKNLITRGRKLENIFLYEGAIYPISSEKKSWYKELTTRSDYIIKTSFDKISKSGAIEKKIDIKIAIDVVSLAYENAYDTAVLVSGDGDFVPVVKKLKKLGKGVEIWAFKYSLANVLKEEMGRENVYFLDDILNELQINSGYNE